MSGSAVALWSLNFRSEELVTPIKLVSYHVDHIRSHEATYGGRPSNMLERHRVSDLWAVKYVGLFRNIRQDYSHTLDVSMLLYQLSQFLENYCKIYETVKGGTICVLCSSETRSLKQNKVEELFKPKTRNYWRYMHYFSEGLQLNNMKSFILFQNTDEIHGLH